MATAAISVYLIGGMSLLGSWRARSIGSIGSTGLAAAALACSLAWAGAGCRERAEPPPPPREKMPPRRVIDPPATVRPLPPYAISNTAVGPYHLGATMANTLYEVRARPRMALLDVPGLVKQNVIRAEDDGVLVSGAVLGDATVIAVVSKDVARTDSGIAVGSTRDDVVRELGVASDPLVARDPRLLVPLRMPAARLVMQDDRVEAFLLRVGSGGLPPQEIAATSPPAPPSQSQPGAANGPASPSANKLAPHPAGKSEVRGKLTKNDPKLLRDAKTGAPVRCAPAKPAETEAGPWQAACLSAAGEIVRIAGDDISVRSGDGKERVIAQLKARGLAFAAPLRSGTRPEDRDELVVVTRQLRPDDQERTWTVALYHLEAGRLVRVAEQVVYRLSAEGARWIGVSLDEVDLYLELTSREDVVVAGGFLLTKVTGKIRDVVSLREEEIGRRRGLETSGSASGALGAPGAAPMSGNPGSDLPAPLDAGADAEASEPDAAP